MLTNTRAIAIGSLVAVFAMAFALLAAAAPADAATRGWSKHCSTVVQVGPYKRLGHKHCPATINNGPFKRFAGQR